MAGGARDFGPARQRQKDALEASWAARDRAELLEARALIADLHAQLDCANAVAVRLARKLHGSPVGRWSKA